jgi:hypothetical protein
MGILMYMSVVSLPSMRLFWKKAMNISAISKVRSYLGGGGGRLGKDNKYMYYLKSLEHYCIQHVFFVRS